MEDEDLSYVDTLLEEIYQVAQESNDPDLQEFADKIRNLLREVQTGQLTKAELLRRLAALEAQYKQGTDPDPEQTLSELKQTGKELAKTPNLRKLGQALAKGNLKQAQKQMHELARKLEKNQLSSTQKQAIAKALQKAADTFQQRTTKHQDKANREIASLRSQVKLLQKKHNTAKTPHEKRVLSRRLKQKKRQLKTLQRQQEQRQASAQKRRLQRLHRNLKRAADQMQTSQPGTRQQASRTLRDVAAETGKVEHDRRKLATQKKVATQLEDLREAMRRARQRQKGPRDLFGKNKRKQDFLRRARGQGRNRSAWKPGQSRGKLSPGSSSKQPNGTSQTNAPDGNSPGNKHDPNLFGGSTPKVGQTQDTSVSGIHGRGPSTRQTILSAAQKGFASRSYRKVFARYKSVVEDVMQTENVPPGYKYYIKRYFQTIKPHSMD